MWGRLANLAKWNLQQVENSLGPPQLLVLFGWFSVSAIQTNSKPTTEVGSCPGFSMPNEPNGRWGHAFDALEASKEAMVRSPGKRPGFSSSLGCFFWREKAVVEGKWVQAVWKDWKEAGWVLL